jgi:tripartite ATP-independent transporter DctP family solute receptor
MMLKKFRCLALMLVLILVIVSCTTFAAVKPIKLVYGTCYPADSFLSKGDIYFKKLVEKNSKGLIKVDFFPTNQLGTTNELIQATRNGAQQLTIVSPGDCSTIMPKLATFDLPYVYRDEKHQLKVAAKINSVINPNEFAANTGMRILNARIRSPRHLTTKIPVNKISDIKGLKIRVPENKILNAIIKAWGAIPTVIPGSETYTALATGVVDGQENPFADIYQRKFYEQTKYCALTAHSRGIVMMVINDKCWKSLTVKQRKILTDAAAKSAKKGIEDVNKETEDAYNMLVKEGMQFTKPDLTPFIEKTETMRKQFGDKDLIKKINAIK